MASPTCIDALAIAQRQNRGERKGGTRGSAKVALHGVQRLRWGGVQRLRRGGAQRIEVGECIAELLLVHPLRALDALRPRATCHQTSHAKAWRSTCAQSIPHLPAYPALRIAFDVKIRDKGGHLDKVHYAIWTEFAMPFEQTCPRLCS